MAAGTKGHKGPTPPKRQDKHRTKFTCNSALILKTMFWGTISDAQYAAAKII